MHLLFCARIEAAQKELRMLSDTGKDGCASVEPDQQSIVRLSRMDAIQQQSIDLAREARCKLRTAMLVAALRRINEDKFGYFLAFGEYISPWCLKVNLAVTLCIECVDSQF